jgi:hypothetical protein
VRLSHRNAANAPLAQSQAARREKQRQRQTNCAPTVAFEAERAPAAPLIRFTVSVVSLALSSCLSSQCSAARAVYRTAVMGVSRARLVSHRMTSLAARCRPRSSAGSLRSKQSEPVVSIRRRLRTRTNTATHVDPRPVDTAGKTLATTAQVNMVQRECADHTALMFTRIKRRTNHARPASSSSASRHNVLQYHQCSLD